MAVVNGNLAKQLQWLYSDSIRIIYFARFEQEKGIAEQSSIFDTYEIVGCEGGVWKEQTVKDLINLYNVDIVYCQPKGVLIYGKKIKPIEEIKIGDKVLTHKGNFKKVINKFKYKYNGDLVWISTDYGIKIPFSPEHKIFIRRFTKFGAKKLLVKASNLKLGNDYVWIPFHNLHSKPFKLDKDFLRLIGYYVAKGSVSKDGLFWAKDDLVSFSFNEKEKKLYNDAATLVRKYWNPKTIRIKKVGRGCVAVRFYSRKIAKWLKENCGRRAENKHFPSFYLQLNNAQMMELLNGYMAGDGYKNIASTVSKILAHQIRLMNLRFKKMIGISYDEKRKAYTIYGRTQSKYARGILQNKGLWIKIRNIWKESYNGFLYNFEVEKDNSYVAEGIATHNSEDDWWSMEGLIKATQATKTPFYFMTPIDSLPIQREAKVLLEKYPYKVFVPNTSYKYLKNGVKLRHAVDTQIFKPVRPKLFDKWTFLWIGRDERRKALGRAILAYEKLYKKYDFKFVVRSNWGATPMSRATYQYINNKKLPITIDRMTNCPHRYLAQIYSGCHAFICTSKAGGCEMSILEAQACTLPVLATDWTFMCEQLINKKAGWKIPIDGFDIRGKPKEGGIEGKGRIWGNISIDELSKKMEWMLNNQDKAIKQGYRGFDWVRKNFNWKDVAQKFYNIVFDDLEKRKLYKLVGEL